VPIEDAQNSTQNVALRRAAAVHIGGYLRTCADRRKELSVT